MNLDHLTGGERIRRNVNISGRRTSVSLERAVWDAISEICKRERISTTELFNRVDETRLDASLASALRVFILTYFRALLAPPAAEANDLAAASAVDRVLAARQLATRQKM